MTVTNETRSVNYVGDTIVTVFPYTFLVPSTTEVEVRVYNSTTLVWTTISSSEYGITGVGVPTGGNITYPLVGTPLGTDERIYISREVGYTQELDIPQTGEFDSSALEGQLDDIVFQTQQNRDFGEGALRAPDGETFETLPPKDTLGGRTILFDETTNEPVAGPTASEISGASESAAAAAASAAAAATSETNAATSAAEAEAAVEALKWKGSVKAATTAAITLSGEQTVDGVALVAGDRCLVKDQSPTSDNGIYLVAAGAWIRTTDADTWDELVSAVVVAEHGTLGSDRPWLCTANSGGTLGSTALPWTPFGFDGGVISTASAITVGLSDKARLVRVTATQTVSLEAAATLGEDFKFYVRADGGTVTIDPDGAELIDGAATATLADGEAAVVFCDGTGFYLVKGGAGGGQFKGNNGTVGNAPGDIFRVNSQTLIVDTTIAADENASCTGPLTVSASATLTVNGNLSVV